MDKSIKEPIRAYRTHEPYYTPEPDEEAEYAAQPFTRIEDADGNTVAAVHDLFTFKPGHAERIVACVNACAGIPTAALQKAAALGDDRLAQLAWIATVYGVGRTNL